MQMDYFKYLIDLAETKSLSQTAERFFLTHQAMSKALKKMEQDFAVNLLIRTKKGVELTDAGNVFLSKSYEILEKYNELNESLEPFRIEKKQNDKAELVILTIPKFLEMNLPSIITGFYSSFPAINISFRTDSHNNILFNSEYDDATIGLITVMDFDWLDSNFMNQLESRNLKINAILASNNLIVMHKNSKWAESMDSDTFDINKIPKIHFAYTASLPADYHGNYIVSNIESMRKLVLNKQGVGILSQFEYDKFFHKSKNIVNKQLDEGGGPIYYAYIIKKQDSLPPYMEKFIASLKKVFN
jgi:Transcriptional regulator